MNRCVVKGWDANPALNAKFKHLDPWEVWIFWGLEAAVILASAPLW